MKRILIRVFAVIGVLFTAGIFIGSILTWYYLSTPLPAAEEPESVVLALNFEKPVTEQARSFSLKPLALLEAEEENNYLFDLIRAIDKAKKDPKVKGLIARFGSAQPSLVHAQELRAALQRFRESGKFTYAFAPNYGNFSPGNRTYFLASAFENIWLQPIGVVGLTGIGLEAPFVKTALEEIGIRTDFMRREEYKSVMENVVNESFSAPVRANMTSLLKNLAEQEIQGIAESRKLDIAKVQKLFGEGPFLGEEALREKLVTRIGYRDELLKEIDEKAGKDSVRVDAPTYLSYSRTESEAPKTVVAFINASGLISDAALPAPSRIAGDRVIDTNKIVEAFADAVNDEEVKAIFFRVDSPGGSPTASETIRRAIVQAKAANKPVFVSMGQIAASGGYWISMSADHIVAAPATITGSIGVIAGKFVLGGLWENLGIKWDSLATAENAKMWSLQAPFSPRSRERVNAFMDETYKAFVKNVAEARKIPLEKMPDIAKGRVFTGEQAVKVGLVDEVGGIQTTVEAIKKNLKLDPSTRLLLKTFPEPETPTTAAIKLLKNLGLESAMVRSLFGSWMKIKSALGPAFDEIASDDFISAKTPFYVREIAR